MAQIIRGMAIPAKANGRTGKWSNLVRRMDVGDAVKLRNYNEVGSLTSAAKKQGFRIVTRKRDGGIFAWKMAA